jgi:hypothetical protein
LNSTVCMFLLWVFMWRRTQIMYSNISHEPLLLWVFMWRRTQIMYSNISHEPLLLWVFMWRRTQIMYSNISHEPLYLISIDQWHQKEKYKIKQYFHRSNYDCYVLWSPSFFDSILSIQIWVIVTLLLRIYDSYTTQNKTVK